MINKLLGAALTVVIGLALFPVVIDAVDGVVTSYTGTFGAGAETLLTILPLLYIVIVVAGAIAYIKYSD